MEFVATKSRHEFHEFHENNHCHLDVVGSKYNFFTVSPAVLLDSTFNCTPCLQGPGKISNFLKATNYQ
ncbi:MAG: hypothetical protein DMG08_06410 [Acidobacteria bacterium]|nr:MAG: hypothetical protein DMG08_06410 [Acidobacteriota bacterium]